MCGIIGFSGKLQAKPIVLKGLHSLEYRGYDSAGIALASESGFEVIKCSGRVNVLEDMCKDIKLDSLCGIGHTRWATHGAPTAVNAHPHSSEKCIVVHNGIIENYIEIKHSLEKEGYIFKSETDTECICHLVDFEYKKDRDAIKSIRRTIKQLKGSFAVAIMFNDRLGEIWCFRRDNPLIAVKNKNGTYIASDIPAIFEYSKEILRPNDNEILKIDGKELYLYNDDKLVDFETEHIGFDIGTAEKDGYDHFMLKEIFEQPNAIIRTVRQFINGEGLIDLSSIGLDYSMLKKFDSISVIGCGSATHAGLVGKFIIEKLVNIPVFVTTASEYRYCPPITVGNTLTVSVSQSGETADTLAALRISKKSSGKCLGIINSVGSAIARESDYVIYTNAGPEIAVATTKGYTTQLAAFVVLALALAKAKNTIPIEKIRKITSDFMYSIPRAIEGVISQRNKIRSIAEKISETPDLYFIGRGVDNFASVECSLKLKEVSYIHSEAYAAGELKHGTLSLIEKGTPVVAISTDSMYFEKMLGNIKEVAARGAMVITVCDEKFPNYKDISSEYFVIQNPEPILSPIISVVFSQLLAYETALLRGCDIDHPRNLAKSVTVE